MTGTKSVHDDHERPNREENESGTQAHPQSYSVVLGGIVYARRMQLHLSQQQLASMAGTTQKQISLLETAKGNIGLELINRVFRVLKLTAMTPTFDEEAAVRA